jgi:hypothetical protein
MLVKNSLSLAINDIQINSIHQRLGEHTNYISQKKFKKKVMLSDAYRIIMIGKWLYRVIKQFLRVCLKHNFLRDEPYGVVLMSF